MSDCDLFDLAGEALRPDWTALARTGFTRTASLFFPDHLQITLAEQYLVSLYRVSVKG